MTDSLTTDLVARIREHEGAYLFPKTADALLKEAADEIERLRERVQKMAPAYRESLEWQPDDEGALSRG